MAAKTDTGSSPAPQTGVEEDSGEQNLDLFQTLLKREQTREEPEEVEPEPEVETPLEVPPEEEEPESEPQEEVEAEEEEEPEPEEEEVLSQPEEEPRIPQKRLNKEVARRKDLEERLHKAQAREAELRDTLQRQEQEAPVAPPKDTLPDVTSPQALARLEQDTEAAVDALEERLLQSPDSVNDSGDEVYTIEKEQYTRQDIGMMLLNAKRRLRREIPQKKDYLQKRYTVEQKARELHPWLEDNTSNESQMFRAITAARPWVLQNDPAGTLFVAAAVEGLKVLQQRGQEAEKPVQKKKVAPVAVETAGSVPKRQVKRNPRKQAEARRKQLTSKGKLEGRDLRDYFKQQELDKEDN